MGGANKYRLLRLCDLVKRQVKLNSTKGKCISKGSEAVLNGVVDIWVEWMGL